MGNENSATSLAQSKTPPIKLREIDINVTNLCNLECIYCSYSSTPSRSEPELAADSVHRLLDQAASIGTQVIHFSGGEPVIRRDMCDLIRHASELGFKMRMHSNGALFSEARLEQVWDAGLRQVLVSLDGFQENHDFHRASEGLYPKTVRGLKNAVRRGFNVRVNSVATRRNVDEIPDLMPMLADIGVATFSVFYLIAIGRGRHQQHLAVPPQRWRQFIEEMKEAALRHKPDDMEVTVEKVFRWDDEWSDEALAQGRGGTCMGFLNECNYVNVLADGRVYPCVCFVDHGPPLGNINQEPMDDILHNPDRWQFYWRLLETNPICNACEFLGQCGGGCRALGRAVRNDWFALDSRCSGEPRTQGYIPLCFMLRENITTGSQSGFAERLQSED